MQYEYVQMFKSIESLCKPFDLRHSALLCDVRLSEVDEVVFAAPSHPGTVQVSALFWIL